MRAVNLMPAEERPSGGGAAGRSGGAAYLLVGVLAVLVAVSGYYTLQQRGVANDRAELVRMEAEATTTEARAASLAPFAAFAGMRASREQTITSLASSRFDWAHALDELARVIPADVTLSGLTATVAPGVSVPAQGASNPLRAALPVPAIELAGCTSSQSAVARMVARMRLIDGVIRVSLKSSTKPEAAAGAAPPSGAASSPGSKTATACPGAADKNPTFALVAFLDPTIGGVPTRGTGRTLAAAAIAAQAGATSAANASGGTP